MHGMTLSERACSADPGPSAPRPCDSCPMLRAGFCSTLPVSTLRRLAERSIRLRLDAHSPVPVTANGAGHGILLRGYLGNVHVGADGHRRISAVTLPGEYFTLPASGPGELETLTEAEICQIHPTGYRQAMEDSAFRRALYAQSRSSLGRLHMLALALGALTPEERFIAFIANAMDVMPWEPLPGGGGILTIEVDRADIADLLGTTVESISRITHRLDSTGLIRIRDPWHFEVPDPAGLRAKAEIRVATAKDRRPAKSPLRGKGGELSVLRSKRTRSPLPNRYTMPGPPNTGASGRSA